MKRSVSQVIYRHLPGSVLYDDDSEVIGLVTNVEGSIDEVVDAKRLARAVTRQLSLWVEGGGELRGLAAPVRPDQLTAIRPAVASWTPFPPEVKCPNCSRVANIADPGFAPWCTNCRSRVLQLRYVYIHQCGNLSYLRPLNQITCPRHARTALSFVDTGRFATAMWRCQSCTYERNIGIVPCGAGCVLTDAMEQEGLTATLRGAVWSDPWVFHPQLARFVNVDEELSSQLTSSPEGCKLILNAAAGALPAGRGAMVQALADGGAHCLQCGRPLTVGARFCAQCGVAVPNASSSGPGPMLEADSELATLALLRDAPQSRSLAAEARDPARPRHTVAAARLGTLGVRDVTYVANFPVTMGAFGYSRILSRPPAALRAFQTDGDRLRVYTDSRSTEGWLVQLDADSLSRWLHQNGIDPGEYDAGGPLGQFALGAAIAGTDEYITLLHSLAHAAVQALARLGGLEDDSLAEILMPEAMSFAIYASSGELGALAAVFDQSIVAFAEELPAGLATCRFDPVCSELENAACLECLQLARSCERYNSNLSRAVLINQPSSETQGYWSL